MKHSSDINELKKMQRASLLKMIVIAVIVVLFVVFSSIAWFTQSREVAGTGTQMTAADLPFDVRVTGYSGLYDDYFSQFDSEYSDDTSTSSDSQKIKLRLTSSRQMNNLYNNGSGAPSSSEMRKIQKIDSEDYGLKPGDYGELAFIIVPKSDQEIDITAQLKTTCYRTEYDSNGYQKDNSFTRMVATNEDDLPSINFLSGHIVYFYKSDTNDDGIEEMHLIKNQTFDVEQITEDREVVLYWFWPKKLSDILDLTVEELDETGCLELREYFFENPELFLQPINDNESFANIKLAPNATNEQIEGKIAIMKETNQIYNSYISKYNNADQTIGDNVGYIMFEIALDLKEE